jgi:hypothetical protein
MPAALGLPACAVESEGEMSSAMTPWHMWGTTETILVPTNGPAFPPLTVSGQLAKVSYGRPDTWSFLMAADIIGGPAVTGGGTIAVDFDVTAGVGRSSTTLVSFMRFAWVIPPAVPVTGRGMKWSSVGRTPIPEEDAAVPASRLVELFPAEDIQVQVRVNVGMTIGSDVRVAVSAYFAPRTHARPDWFRDKFAVGEVGRG